MSARSFFVMGFSELFREIEAAGLTPFEAQDDRLAATTVPNRTNAEVQAVFSGYREGLPELAHPADIVAEP